MSTALTARDIIMDWASSSEVVRSGPGPDTVGTAKEEGGCSEREFPLAASNNREDGGTLVGRGVAGAVSIML